MDAGEEHGHDGPLPPGQRRSDRWRPSTYGRVPHLDPATWSVAVGGATRDGALHLLDRDALERLPHVEVRAGLHCVDRHTVPDLVWSGWRMADVVACAPPAPGCEHALLAAARGYSAAVLLEDLLHPDALLATHVDGQPLTADHGWPGRVVLPHLYGFKGPKWFVELTYHLERPRGYWESHGYHPRGRVHLEERWAHQE